MAWTEGASIVDHFNVLRQAQDGSYALIAQVPGNQTFFTDSGLTPGGSYSYEVIASNAGGDSAAAGPVGATTPAPPEAPSNLQATLLTTTQITLTWQNNATDATGYKVVRQLASNNSQQIAILPPDATSFADTNLLPGKPYQYTVVAYNMAGPSTGAAISLQTLALAPQGLTATGDVGQIDLSWSPSTGASSYNIYRGLSPGGEDTTPIATVTNTTSFSDAPLPDGAVYYYRVTAADSAGESAPSNEALAQTIVLINAADPVDYITLVHDPDQQNIDWTMGSAGGKLPIDGPGGLTINGSGTDIITLEYSHGDPLPAVLHLNGTFTINGLQGADPLLGHLWDIGRSTVYISYADPSSDPIAAIVGYLRNGYNNGAWTGSTSSPQAGTAGVITSAAATSNVLQTTAIGYADSADGLIAGQPANTIELKYTLYGDTTLTGAVGVNDFTTLTQSYNQTTGGTWDTGDFNYDGSINFNDFTLLTRTYNTSLGTQAAPATAPTQAVSTTASAPPTVSGSKKLPAVQVKPMAPTAKNHAPAHPQPKKRGR